MTMSPAFPGLRMVAGFPPGGTDTSTSGYTWRGVLAEHERAARVFAHGSDPGRLVPLGWRAPTLS